MTTNNAMRYNPAITSQFGVVGIGLLVESVAKAAATELSGFFNSGHQVLAIQTRSRKTRQLPPRGFTGRPTCLDCHPDWSLSGSHHTTEPSEAEMPTKTNTPSGINATLARVVLS